MKTTGKKVAGRVAGARVTCRAAGTHLVWPSGVQQRYGVSKATVWQWEQRGKLPPRDAFIDGKPVGWKPETLDAALSGKRTGASIT
jgi:hypothetical protein